MSKRSVSVVSLFLIKIVKKETQNFSIGDKSFEKKLKIVFQLFIYSVIIATADIAVTCVGNFAQIARMKK